jgi:hypothetical protein
VRGEDFKLDPASIRPDADDMAAAAHAAEGFGCTVCAAGPAADAFYAGFHRGVVWAMSKYDFARGDALREPVRRIGEGDPRFVASARAIEVRRCLHALDAALGESAPLAGAMELGPLLAATGELAEEIISLAVRHVVVER